MFKPMSDSRVGPHVTIEVDGRASDVRTGVSLAMALMEADIVLRRRTAVSGAPRSPLCLMGPFKLFVRAERPTERQSC
jgi:hypothetical protein